MFLGSREIRKVLFSENSGQNRKGCPKGDNSEVRVLLDKDDRVLMEKQALHPSISKTEVIEELEGGEGIDSHENQPLQALNSPMTKDNTQSEHFQ